MNTLPTSEVLNLAADAIEERGWGTGNQAMRMDGTPLCLEGGIAAAMGLPANLRVAVDRDGNDVWIVGHASVQECPAYAAVRTYLGDRCINTFAPDEPNAALWAWNDTVAKSAEEVVGVLRAVAVIEAAKEHAAQQVTA